MRDSFSIFFSGLSIVLGGTLLYSGVANNETNQTSLVIAGAAFLALGLILSRIMVRNWLKEKALYRTSRSASREL
jgi:phosphatidylserine synthase